MLLTKVFYWNIQNRVYKYFPNLNSLKQCKRSQFSLLFYNATVMNKSKMNENNNPSNISTTAAATPGASNRGSTTSNSRPIPVVRSSRNRISTRSRQNQESTSLFQEIPSNYSAFFSTGHNYVHPNSYPFLNPYFDFNFEQRQYSDLATQGFSNICLFREQYDATSSRESRERPSKRTERRNKYVAENLRHWIPVLPPIVNSSDNNSFQLKLLSYNVLAQDLVTEHAYLYRNHSPRALLWETRWKNLYNEIVSYDADIICLQEVQESHLRKYYSQIETLGFGSLFKKRTGIRTDGCAIYYRKSILKLVENTTVEYNQDRSLLDRDNVAIIAKFVPRNNKNAEFVVATTHLLYNPRRTDVRLAQTQLLLAEVERIAYKGDVGNKYLPIIITGDFNSEPDSAVIELIVKGNLKYDHLASRNLKAANSTSNVAGKVLISPDLRITDTCQHADILVQRALGVKLSRNEELKLVKLRHSKRESPPVANKTSANDTLFSTGILSHELNLRSAFLYQVGNDTEGTTNQNGWITVDYIFYSGQVKLQSRYSVPTKTELQEVKNIPNYALGSDHLALMSSFIVN